MVVEKSSDVVGSDDQAMHLMVDALRKGIFAAQKTTGVQLQQSQSLLSCLSALSSALDLCRKESSTTSSLILNSVNKNISTIATTSSFNPSFRLHVNSIIQSMYTLFTRVLTPPAIKQASLGAPALVNSSIASSATTDVKNTIIQEKTFRAEVKVVCSTVSKQLPVFDDQLLLKAQSMGLLSSVATCDPSTSFTSRHFLCKNTIIFRVRTCYCTYYSALVSSIHRT